MSMQDRNSTIKDNYYSSQLHACMCIHLFVPGSRVQSCRALVTVNHNTSNAMVTLWENSLCIF